MSVKFEVNMTRKCLFQFLMYHTYTRFSGLLGLTVGLIVMILGVREVIISDFSGSLIYFGFAIFFLLLMPYMMWLGAGRQMARNPLFKSPILYEMNEEGVSLLAKEPQSITWDKVQKGFWNKKIVALYMANNQAMIFPREAFKEDDAKAIDLLSRYVQVGKKSKLAKEETKIDEGSNGDS